MGNTSKFDLEMLIKVHNQAMAPLNAVKKGTEKVHKEVTKVNKEMGRWISGGMSLLFTGMALKRFFGGALRSIWNTYQQIIDVNDQFLQKTQKLHAAWEFLKFSIVEALSQSPLIIDLIGGIIGIINRFNELGPEAKAALGEAAIAVIVLATAMLVLGQALLFVFGISQLFQITMMSALGWMLIILLPIIALWAIWRSGLSEAQKIILTIIIGVGILAGILFKIGIIGALGFGVIIALLLVLAVLIAFFWKDILAGAEKMWIGMKLVALKIEEVFLSMVNKIIFAIQDMINWILSVLPKDITDKLGFGKVSFQGTDVMPVRKRINELILEGISIEERQEAEGRTGFSAESLKNAFKEGLSDMLPDLGDSIAEANAKLGITMPSTST